MNLDQVDSLSFFVPLAPEEVSRRLAEHTTWLPLWRAPDGLAIGPKRFVGRVEGDRFSVLMSRFRRRNFRPVAEGRLEAIPGGTMVHVTAQIPAWARYLGRFTTVATGLGGLGAAGFLAYQGQPADMPAALYYGLLGLTGVWMPFLSVVVPGYLVAEGVEERQEVLDALQKLFADVPNPEAQGIAEVDAAVSSEATRARPGVRANEGGT